MPTGSTGSTGSDDADQPLRDVLLGQLPLEAWIGDEATEPWQRFASARRALAAGDVSGAIEAWQSIVSTDGYEARHYVQAWRFLRAQGEVPPDELAKRVYGVVIEHWVDTGFDLLAAYSDGHARYFNHAGGGVVWERLDDSLDAVVDDVIAAGGEVALVIGPWEGPEPPPLPAPNEVRLNICTPSGLHFGSGPAEAMYEQPLARLILTPGATLMQRLIEQSDTETAPSSG